MSNSPYLYEKLVATRHAEIRQAMQQSHKSTHAEKPSTFASNAADRFGTMLVELGTRLQRTKHQHKASLS